MSTQRKPNVVASLLAIHAVVTRGLEVACTSAKPVSETSHGTPTLEGFLNYVRALSSVLHGHHLTEDELAFPYFKNKMPEVPFELLTAQHREIVSILHEVNAAVGKCNEGLTSGGFDQLGEALESMLALWRPHVQIEEKHFTFSRLESLRIPDEEHAGLLKQIVEHSQKHTGPPYLVLPFMLYNLPPDARALMAAEFPPEVTGHLIPIVWKDQWASMMPFLLQP